MRARFAFLLFVVAGVLLAASATAQPRVRGSLSGRVTADDGTPLPGVTVTAKSESLQGERSTVTGESGEYILRDLPAGAYEVTYLLEGMTTATATQQVEVGQASSVDVEMKIEGVEETIQVTADVPNAMENQNISGNFDYEEINSLANPRDLDGIALLAPGVNSNTQLAGQIQINGAFSFDNVFLVDGVDVTDSVFAQPNDLYIEDAIEETQVLTSGISAEYGRFTGGVVNAITKSGGNEFSGTFRTDFTNPSWRDETPFEEDQGTERDDTRNEIYTATLGGRILRDKLWFFLAGRDADQSTQVALSHTAIPFAQDSTDERYEGKLTANIAQSHTLQGTWTDTEQATVRPSTSVGSDLTTIETIEFPQELLVGRYSGVLTSSLFVEGQYSEKEFGFRHIPQSGGISTDIRDSPVRCWNVTPDCHYNGVYFDATDPEDRNNEQIAGSVSWFLDNQSVGSHDLKFGYENFTNINVGGNSQSASDFVFFHDFLANEDGSPVLINGEMQPAFVPEDGLGVRFEAERGARLELEVESLYVNDHWTLNDHWSFNLGVRFEEVSSETNAGDAPVDTDAVAPRLGVSYDLRGDGKYRFDATYGQYTGGYGFGGNNFGSVTNVGNPNYVYGPYIGPEGSGKDFAPGFDPDNYVFVAGSFGAASNFTAPDLSSPSSEEFTLSFGVRLSRGGFIRASLVDRSMDDFVVQTNTLETGSVEIFEPGLGMVEPLTFNNTLLENTSRPTRDYQGSVLQARYRILENLLVEGHWTHQFDNEGDYEGEAGQSFGGSNHTSYPELLDERNFAFGRLDEYQEDRIRVWSIYTLGLGRFGDLSGSLLFNYDTGTAYDHSTRFDLTATQVELGEGYASLPTQPTLWFGEKGAATFPDYSSFDFGLLYDLPIYKELAVFVKADVFNVFNDRKQIGFNTTVLPWCPPTAPGSTLGSCDGVLVRGENNLGRAVTGVVTPDAVLDSLGRPTQFSESAAFGDATSNNSYNTPREYRFSVGIRF